MVNGVYLEGFQVGLRLDKNIWQWIVRNPDYNIHAEGYLGVVRYSDGGDLRRC